MGIVIVVGGGAAGMMASISAAQSGNEVLLLEQNEKLGKKIYITGKGRCNLTNAVPVDDFMPQIFKGQKFAYSSLYALDPFHLMDILESSGLELKVERGNRVFPASDKASDVTKHLMRLMSDYNVRYELSTKVTRIRTEDDHVIGISTADGRELSADRVIVCCGGKSYPLTGSDGNGYDLVSALGHTIIPPQPALVPMLSNESWVSRLSGLGLKNISVTLYEKDRKIGFEFGEMLFTHKGLSGPVILSLSCFMEKGRRYHCEIDLKPALDESTLEKRLLRDFEAESTRTFRHALDQLLPKSLAYEIVLLTKINPDKKINQITVNERKLIIQFLKHLKISIHATAGFNEAIITKGGVDLKQINSSTMESKLINGLFLTGEMIDLHGFTGGFNLQLAFSTGFLAGLSCFA